MKTLNLLVLMLLLASLIRAQDYSNDWGVTALGGGQTETEDQKVLATVGQNMIGESSSNDYVIRGGFWLGPGVRAGECVYVSGDVNHNGMPLELSDVVTMISNYRGASPPSYICDCGTDPPGPGFAATADPNGNCVAFELGDVVTEIGAYRGTAEATGCPDCPGSLRLIPGGNDDLTVIPTLKNKIGGKRATVRK